MCLNVQFNESILGTHQNENEARCFDTLNVADCGFSATFFPLLLLQSVEREKSKADETRQILADATYAITETVLFQHSNELNTDDITNTEYDTTFCNK